VGTSKQRSAMVDASNEGNALSSTTGEESSIVILSGGRDSETARIVSSGFNCPFKNGRSDLLAGRGSKLDLENVNLLATLLIHAEHQGYWSKLGERFQEDMQSLLTGICLPDWSPLRGSAPMRLTVPATKSSCPPSKSWSRMPSKSPFGSRSNREFSFHGCKKIDKFIPRHPA
jgi:hypothetical protein